MDYKIVADSSCDLNEELKSRLNIELIPFKLTIGEEDFVDTEDMDMKHFLTSMKNSSKPLKSSCPSPGDFLSSYQGANNIFVITISKNLSATYESAVLARNMALEKEPDKFIHVFDSKSGSVGESLVALKIYEFLEQGFKNEEIVEKVETHIDKLDTYLISEDLSNIIKSGRLSKTKGFIANILNFKPIMGSDGDGNIVLIENIRGSKKAFNRLIEIIGEKNKNFKDLTLGIAHSNAYERATELKETLKNLYKFKDVVIVETKGLSTGYINNEGILLAF